MLRNNSSLGSPNPTPEMKLPTDRVIESARVFQLEQTQVKCEDCDGQGKTPDGGNCLECHGKGTITVG